MTVTVFAKHLPYETGHLGDVVADMRYRGAPTIRVMRFNSTLFATEGSHRLAAAHALGLEPKLVVEVADTDDGLRAFWQRAAVNLPVYDFTHAHILNLADFV